MAGVAVQAFRLGVRKKIHAKTRAGQVARDDGGSAPPHPRRLKYRGKVAIDDGSK
ncbi:unnamed protein product, partial [Ilex paraguariensis]